MVFCAVALALAACAGDRAVESGRPEGVAAGKQGDGAWQAVLGGMSDAAAGNAVTQYMDGQARELIRIAEVQRIGDGVIVTLNNPLLFDTGSATLKAKAHATLRKLAAVFKRYPKTVLTVAGHTDNQGPTAYNLGLSERRAKAVADYLAGAGIAPARIRIMGLGFERPRAANDSAEGRARNRRVEIHIAPSRELRDQDQPPQG